MNARWLLAVGVAAAPVACTLTTDLSGLSGGTIPVDAAVDGPELDAGGDALIADAAHSADANADADADAAAALGCGAADAGLVAYWPIEEGKGTAISDCSGNGLNGTLLGNGIWVAGHLPSTKALLFDATNTTYIDVPNSPIANEPGAVTVAAWVKLQSGINSYLVTKGGNSPTLSWSLEMEVDGTVSFYVSTTGQDSTANHSSAAPQSTWFHFAAVFDPGKTQTIYVNGLSVNSVAPSPTLYQGTQHINIGFQTKGAIDDARVFSRALSAAEIQTLASE